MTDEDRLFEFLRRVHIKQLPKYGTLSDEMFVEALVDGNWTVPLYFKNVEKFHDIKRLSDLEYKVRALKNKYL